MMVSQLNLQDRWSLELALFEQILPHHRSSNLSAKWTLPQRLLPPRRYPATNS